MAFGLPIKPQEWFEIAVKHHELSVLALDMEICISSTGLPLFHNDPCDRFIIATAKQYNLPVVTTGSRFQDYGIRVIS